MWNLIIAILFLIFLVLTFAIVMLKFEKKGHENARAKVRNIKVSEKPNELMMQYSSYYFRNMDVGKNYNVTIRIEEL